MQLVVALAASAACAIALLSVIVALSRRFLLVRQISFPLAIGAVAASLGVLSTFAVVDTETLAPVLRLAVLLAAATLVLRLALLAYFDYYLHGKRGLRLPPLLPSVATWVIYLVAGLVTLRIVFPALELDAILATSGITALVLGLALQPILGNFFAGLVISLEKPFRINDWIRVGTTEGRVVNITWRTTHLRTRDNDNLVLPNAKIANQEIVNFYYPHPLHLVRVCVGAHYRTPPYRVKQALLDVAERVESILDKPSPSVFLLDFADSAVTYEFRGWIEDIASAPRIESHVRSEIWEEFRRRGITIPFPIRTLEIEPSARSLELVRSRRPRELDEDAPYPARLYIARGADRGKRVELGGEPLSVGRSRSCALQLSIPEASGEHFEVLWEDDAYVVVDCESRAGIKVNGRQVERQRLRDLDRISIEDTEIVFEIHD